MLMQTSSAQKLQRRLTLPIMEEVEGGQQKKNRTGVTKSNDPPAPVAAGAASWWSAVARFLSQQQNENNFCKRHKVKRGNDMDAFCHSARSFSFCSTTTCRAGPARGPIAASTWSAVLFPKGVQLLCFSRLLLLLTCFGEDFSTLTTPGIFAYKLLDSKVAQDEEEGHVGTQSTKMSSAKTPPVVVDVQDSGSQQNGGPRTTSTTSSATPSTSTATSTSYVSSWFDGFFSRNFTMSSSKQFLAPRGTPKNGKKPAHGVEVSKEPERERQEEPLAQEPEPHHDNLHDETFTRDEDDDEDDDTTEDGEDSQEAEAPQLKSENLDQQVEGSTSEDSSSDPSRAEHDQGTRASSNEEAEGEQVDVLASDALNFSGEEATNAAEQQALTPSNENDYDFQDVDVDREDSDSTGANYGNRNARTTSTTSFSSSSALEDEDAEVTASTASSAITPSGRTTLLQDDTGSESADGQAAVALQLLAVEQQHEKHDFSFSQPKDFHDVLSPRAGGPAMLYSLNRTLDDVGADNINQAPLQEQPGTTAIGFLQKQGTSTMAAAMNPGGTATQVGPFLLTHLWLPKNFDTDAMLQLEGEGANEFFQPCVTRVTDTGAVEHWKQGEKNLRRQHIYEPRGNRAQYPFTNSRPEDVGNTFAGRQKLFITFGNTGTGKSSLADNMIKMAGLDPAPPTADDDKDHVHRFLVDDLIEPQEMFKVLAWLFLNSAGMDIDTIIKRSDELYKRAKNEFDLQHDSSLPPADEDEIIKRSSELYQNQLRAQDPLLTARIFDELTKTKTPKNPHEGGSLEAIVPPAGATEQCPVLLRSEKGKVSYLEKYAFPALKTITGRGSKFTRTDDLQEMAEELVTDLEKLKDVEDPQQVEEVQAKSEERLTNLARVFVIASGAQDKDAQQDDATSQLRIKKLVEAPGNAFGEKLKMTLEKMQDGMELAYWFSRKCGLRSLPMAAQEKMTNIPKTVWGVFENARPPRLDVEELNNYAQAQRLLEEYHVLGENTLSPLGYADWLDDVTRCVSSGLKPMTQAECKKARSGFERDSTRFALNDIYDIWIGANLVEKVLLWQRNVDRSLAKVRGFTNPWTAETGPRLPKKGWQTDSWVLRNHIVEAWERMQEVPKPKEIMPGPGGSGAIVSREQGGRETEKNLEQEIKPAVTIQHFVLFNNNPNRVVSHIDASQLVMHVEARQFLALAPDASDLVKKGHAYCNKRSLFSTRGTIQTPLMYKQVDDKLDFAHRYYCVTASGQTSSIRNISPGAGSDLPEVEETKQEQLKRLQHDGIKYCEGHKQEGKKETCAASYCKFEMQAANPAVLEDQFSGLRATVQEYQSRWNNAVTNVVYQQIVPGAYDLEAGTRRIETLQEGNGGEKLQGLLTEMTQVLEWVSHFATTMVKLPTLPPLEAVEQTDTLGTQMAQLQLGLANFHSQEPRVEVQEAAGVDPRSGQPQIDQLHHGREQTPHQQDLEVEQVPQASASVPGEPPVASSSPRRGPAALSFPPGGMTETAGSGDLGTPRGPTSPRGLDGVGIVGRSFSQRKEAQAAAAPSSSTAEHDDELLATSAPEELSRRDKHSSIVPTPSSTASPSSPLEDEVVQEEKKNEVA
ncbi:unnamed protein product [Amoebophrya sp. A120]|nr:unnamed protein product [Amoebophrya sp. A120]|eukprot:GSA120T00015875001.1